MAERLSGYFQVTLDGKGRLVLPSKVRKAIGSVVSLQQQEEGSLMIYPQPVWDAEAERLYERSLTNKDAEYEYRFRNQRTTDDVPVDASGRVQIPVDVREKVGLAVEDLVLVGAGDRLELWRPDYYAVFERREEQRLGYNLSLEP